MPIGISYYGNKKPAQGVKPLRTFNLPDTMPKELLPFNKKNPVSWMDGKDLVRFRDDPGCLPKGGDAGQALVKKSGKDADVHWSPIFDPDSLVDSTDFAKSIDVLASGGVSAREIHGFKAGLKEDTSLARLLDVDAPDRTIYSVLARKEVAGQRPETAFIRVGDLTLDGDVLPPEDRDPDGTPVVDCGVGDFPGTLPGDDDSGGFPGDGTPAEDEDTFPGTGTGDTTGDDEFPGKVDDCW
jgi:hypothetical protein